MKIIFEVYIQGVYVTVETDNLTDMDAFLARQLPGDTVAKDTTETAAAEPAPTNMPPVVKAPKETTKARARRKVAETKPVPADPAQTDIEDVAKAPAGAVKVPDLMAALKDSVAPAVVSPPTEEALFEAVKALAARKGVPAVHTVFAGFQINKVSEIAADKRRELLVALVAAT